GADRVEVCADQSAGGTTPSIGLLAEIVETIPIEVMAMIRPRGGDFAYSRAELAVMRRDIIKAAEVGVEGVVFGVLTEEGYLDLEAMRELIAVAKEHSLEVTCHRAFDVAFQPLKFARDLVKLGVDRLLTSGQKPTALEGLDLIKELQKAVGQDLIIMPGVNITSSNVEKILAAGVSELHVYNTEVVESKVKRSTDLTMGAPDYEETKRIRIDEQAIARLVQAVKD
ncbi:MAG TPA: copper homeostasis protein CutC, partial [Firmicutes bacterium]|nr:copper homeostasis protein CutC [Bacillota bacterium]